ncbi:MAG: Ig-like domain-containing protein [Methanobacteriaceae archaeon]|nr:Ig-like domain-containing protein [Methanobacteriaceae archaeon]
MLRLLILQGGGKIRRKAILFLLTIVILITTISAISATTNTTTQIDDTTSTSQNSVTTPTQSDNTIQDTNSNNLKTNSSDNSISKDSINKVSETTAVVSTKTSSVKKTTKTNVNAVTSTVKTKTKFTATIKDSNGNNINTGTVTFKINDRTIGQSAVSNGKTTFIYTIPNWAAKTYSITAKYSENNIYASSQDNNILKITKNSTVITVTSVKNYVGKNVTLNAAVKSSNGIPVKSGNVVFKINGVTIGKAVVSNGVASTSYTIQDWSSKTYTLNAIFAENEDYLASSGKSELSVLKTTTKVSLNSVTGSQGSTIQFVATVKDNTGNNVNTGTVAFKIYGTTLGKATVSNGKAVLNYIIPNWAAKTYTVDVIYGQNSQYKSSTNKNSLTIPLIKTVTQIYSITSTTSQTINIHTSVNTINGDGVNKGEVVFKINDKTIGVTSIINGVASLTYKIPASFSNKKYEISAKYVGSSKYDKSNNDGTLTLLTSGSTTKFSLAEIKTASSNLAEYIEIYGKLPSKIDIAGTSVNMQDYLAIACEAVLLINSGSGNTVQLLNYKNASTSTDTLKAGNFSKANIISIANNTLNYFKTNNKAPYTVSTTLGKLGFYNLVYSMALALDTSSISSICSKISVKSWSTIVSEGLSSMLSRPIYITSDIIYGTSKDYKFIDELANKLRSLGFTVYNYGVGSNKHAQYIYSCSLPSNAIQIPIFGGVCAGTFVDICSNAFMKLKKDRDLFIVFDPNTAKDIRGLDWLERAHDDNFSYSSFTGLANPDEYLRNHGYDFVYSRDVNTIAKALIAFLKTT